MEIDQTDEIRNLNRDEWLTAAQAAEILSANSNREVRPDYVRSLLREQGVTIHTYRLSPRHKLYFRPDIASYQVEPRGSKAARAKKQSSSNT